MDAEPCTLCDVWVVLARMLWAVAGHKSAPSALTSSYATTVATGTRMYAVARLVFRLLADQMQAACPRAQQPSHGPAHACTLSATP